MSPPMTETFDDIYTKYGPMVLRRCKNLLKNESQAAEAMQDTFVKFLSYREQNTHAHSSLLYRIATNVCLNVIRSDSRRLNLENYSDELLQITEYMNEESKLVARNVIAKIFSMEQESTAWMAVMFFHDGMSLKEIALESKLSVSGVRKRLATFGTKLKKLVEEEA
jgi:RNA polymerase sigma-70 factor (ECF subfamily)